MKKISILVITVVASTSLFFTSCNQSGVSSVNLSSPIDSASYAIGVNFGNGLKENLKTFPGGNANVDALINGFTSALKDSASLKITPEFAQNYVNQYFTNIQMQEAEADKTNGNTFLAGNKSKEGVITTESGLQYKVIKEGDGPKPTVQDQVKAHYTGKLLDGTVFDSSVERGEPTTFPLNGVIAGWTEGLQIMPTGSKYIFWIPSDLAYGPNGVPNQQTGGWIIRPNSVLEFEVELLEVIKD